jgi:NAD(P)-dependent dehydrogenase (short-subunit alcohol dehydrogenase family)
MAAVYPDLKGKTVLVTGGASGIGAAIVRRFAGQGCKVALLDLQAAAGQALAEELKAAGGTVHFEQVDLRDIEALQAAVARCHAAFGPTQILVNNAAHDERHATETLTSANWDERMSVNLKHQFFAAQAVLPGMKQAGAGVIVNYGSTSWIIGLGGMAAYTAAKSAVLGLTRSLARDFGPFNIRVNSIAPGWIMTERQIEKWLTPEGEEELLKRQCLKRKLQPDELAAFTLFLASDEASACTGQQYIVDGGWV